MGWLSQVNLSNIFQIDLLSLIITTNMSFHPHQQQDWPLRLVACNLSLVTCWTTIEQLTNTRSDDNFGKNVSGLQRFGSSDDNHTHQ